MYAAMIYLGLLAALGVAIIRTQEITLFSYNSYYWLNSLNLGPEAILLQILLMVVLMWVLIKIKKKYALPEETAYPLLASPAILTSMLIIDPAIILAALLAIATIYYKQTTVLTGIALLCLIISPQAFVLLLVPLAVSIARKKYVHATINVIALITSIFFLQLPKASIQISELGGFAGISIFILMVATIGVITWWNKKTYPYLLSAIYVLLVSMLYTHLRIVAAIIAAIFAGYAIYKLYNREWKLDAIKTISSLLLLCGLLFSAADAGSQAVRFEPTAPTQDLLTFLESIDAKEIYIQTQHPELFEYHGHQVARQLQNATLSSRNIDVIKPFLPTYIVEYKQPLQEQLLFVIENTDDFILVYDREYRVWEVRSDN